MGLIRFFASLAYQVIFLGVTLSLAIVEAIFGERKKERIIIYTRYYFLYLTRN